LSLSREAVLGLGLSLLASTGTANAECAWVLWSGATSPLAGYASKQECDGARNDDHALAQRLSRDYALPQPLECGPDTPITAIRSACAWTLWKFAVPSMRTPAAALERSGIGTFETRELCERWRSPDLMKRDERELTSCLPDTVAPGRPKQVIPKTGPVGLSSSRR
jgi:hypothetical protein